MGNATTEHDRLAPCRSKLNVAASGRLVEEIRTIASEFGGTEFQVECMTCDGENESESENGNGGGGENKHGSRFRFEIVRVDGGALSPIRSAISSVHDVVCPCGHRI